MTAFQTVMYFIGCVASGLFVGRLFGLLLLALFQR